MNTKKITQYFDYQNIDDKHFFAGLLNIAKNNFDVSLNELKKRTNSKNTGKGIITEVFSDSITQADWNTRIDYVSESLAFVKFFKYESRTYVRNTLYKLYETIDNLRNYYTHYNHTPIIIEASIFEVLDKLLLNSALTVKKNRAKSEEYKEYLSIKYKDEFNTIVSNSNHKILKYNKTLSPGEKRREKVKLADEVNHVLNFVFRTFIYNDKINRQEKLSDNASSKQKNCNSLSTYGFVQLLALFLNKKQTQTLLSYTKYLKDTRKLEHVATRWVLTFMCYRDIKRLFKSDYSNDSLLLQMISELTKCPNNLYNNLTVEKKQEFIEDINTYYKDNEEFKGNNNEGLISHEVIQKRYQDKFPYFAIRFLDEIIKFPNLKFHINLGKFNHHTTTKHLKGISISTERSILEKVSVFTKLSTATKNKKEYFLKPENKDLINDWVEFPSPHYQFNKNNIGIWLNLDGTLGKSDAHKERKSSKLTKYDIAEKLNIKEALKKPVAFLSFNELPALLYALLVEKKTPKEIESIIKTKIFEQRNTIREFDKNTNYDSRKIPTKLNNAINQNSPINWKKLESDLQIEIDKNPLEEIRINYKSKPESSNELSNSEKGKIAIWLCDDIKRFTSIKTRKTWKGYQYVNLQALLAFYEYKKNEVKDYLKNELLFDFNKDNPFSGINFTHNSLHEFYTAYLRQRKLYLEKKLRKVESKNRDLDHDIFIAFSKRLYVLKPLDLLKQTYLNNTPVNLPRGIFDNKPTFIKPTNSSTDLASWFSFSNNINNSQKFYQFEKNYEYNVEVLKWNNYKRKNELKEVTKKQKISTSKGLKIQYNNDLPKETQKYIFNNEKLIRKEMRQDCYILEMVKYRLGSQNLNKFTLKDVFLSKAEKLKIEEESKKQSFKKLGDYSENIINDSHILSKRIPITLFGGKICGNVAIKEGYKNLKFEQDKRVVCLLSYFPNKIWTFKEISDEIETYDKVKNFDFFKSVHQLENEIFKSAKEEVNLNAIFTDEGYPNFKKYLSYFYLNTEEEKSQFNDLDFDKITILQVSENQKLLYLLVKIRNKFSHNQLLPKEDFDYLQSKYYLKENENIGNYLLRVFMKIQTSIKPILV